jgi:RimJ/RimL family protein N-acetyltransferase
MSTIVSSPIIPTVLPYYREKENLPKDILRLLYRRLVAEQLDRMLFHNRAVTEEEFVRFAEDEALTSLFLDQANGRFVGLAWLTNIEDCQTIRKGIGSFSFFRDFWNAPLTKAFGDVCLSQWFSIVGLNLVYGITPSPNRLAIRYCRRLGFNYVARIPQFVSYDGETVDADICTLTREQFEARIEAEEQRG